MVHTQFSAPYPKLIHTSIYYYTAAAEIMIQVKDVVREGETRATFLKEPLGA